jgi:tetratricopeptide (TPR) repeat protein
MVNAIGFLGGFVRLATFIVVGLGLACTQVAAESPDAMAAAASALQEGRAAEAEQLATQALGTKDLAGLDHAHLLLNRALAREQMGRRRDALADFNDALALDALPDDERARAFFDRGVTLDELGRTGEAITDYSAALKIATGFAPALNNRANAERRLNRLPEAKADYQAALSAGDKEKEYPYFGLGQIAEIEGDTKNAAEDYRMALAANGNYVLASQRLSALATQPGKIDLQPPAPTPTPAPPLATANYQPPELRPAILGHPKPKRVAAPAAPRPMPTIQGTVTVQLGAFRDEASANAAWASLVHISAGALDGFSPQIVAADIPGKGTFYRLRTAADDASALCAKLTAKGLACMRVK